MRAPRPVGRGVFGFEVNRVVFQRGVSIFSTTSVFTLLNMKILYPFACSALFSVLLLLSGFSLARAQTPAWQQPAVIAPGTNTSSVAVTSTAADATGNVYLTGSFTGTANFGAISLTSASSSYDVFVAKYNSNTRAFVWVKKSSSAAGNFKSAAVAVSGTSVYIAGTFYDSNPVFFGSVSIISNHPNNPEVFVAKLTDTGTDASFIWVQQLGGPSTDTVTGLAVNGANVYVAGRYDGGGPATFGSLSLSALNYSGNAYVAKLNDAGTGAQFVWVRQVTAKPNSSANISVTALSLSGTRLYVAGAANEDFDRLFFDGITSPAVYPNGRQFVAKLEDAGNSASFVWAKPVAAVGGGQITGIAANGSNVYIGGPFSYSIRFGSLGLTWPADGHSFVAKLTDAGSTASFVWACGTRGTTYEVIRGIAVNGSRVYAMGSTDGSGIYYDFDLRITGTRNIFVAGFSDAGPTGSLDWTARAGTYGTCSATAITFARGTAYIVGYVSGGMSFGSYGINGQGSGAGYIAPLPDNTVTATTQHGSAIEAAVFPSPAHATATVQLPPVTGATTATLTLHDALGRTTRTQTLALPATGLRHELDLTGLALGVYALHVQAGAATAVRRLVVE